MQADLRLTCADTIGPLEHPAIIGRKLWHLSKFSTGRSRGGTVGAARVRAPYLLDFGSKYAGFAQKDGILPPPNVVIRQQKPSPWSPSIKSALNATAAPSLCN